MAKGSAIIEHLQAHQSSQQITVIVLVGEHDIQAVEQDQQLSTSRSQ
jgi:hypothetical protein